MAAPAVQQRGPGFCGGAPAAPGRVPTAGACPPARCLQFGIRIVPEKQAFVIERFGRFHKILGSGIHFLIPVSLALRRQLPGTCPLRDGAAPPLAALCSAAVPQRAALTLTGGTPINAPPTCVPGCSWWIASPMCTASRSCPSPSATRCASQTRPPSRHPPSLAHPPTAANACANGCNTAFQSSPGPRVAWGIHGPARWAPAAPAHPPDAPRRCVCLRPPSPRTTSPSPLTGATSSLRPQPRPVPDHTACMHGSPPCDGRPPPPLSPRASHAKHMPSAPHPGQGAVRARGGPGQGLLRRGQCAVRCGAAGADHHAQRAGEDHPGGQLPASCTAHACTPRGCTPACTPCATATTSCLPCAHACCQVLLPGPARSCAQRQRCPRRFSGSERQQPAS